MEDLCDLKVAKICGEDLYLYKKKERQKDG